MYPRIRFRLLLRVRTGNPVAYAALEFFEAVFRSETHKNHGARRKACRENCLLKTTAIIKEVSLSPFELFSYTHIGIDQKRVRKAVFFIRMKRTLYGDVRIRFGIIGGVRMFSAQPEFDSLCAARGSIHDETRERIRTFFFVGIHVKQTVHLYRFADVVFRLDHHIENFRVHHRRAHPRQIDDSRILLF